MYAITREQAIEFLIQREVPNYYYVKNELLSPFFWHGSDVPEEERDAYVEQLKASADECRKKFESLEHAELNEIYTAERERADNEMLAGLAKDAGLILEADFEHWSKAAQWQIDEAIVLAFGLNPRVVVWENLKQYESQSDFVESLANLRDLVRRALDAKELFSPTSPIAFLDWAARLDIDIPSELITLVQQRAHPDQLRGRADKVAKKTMVSDISSDYWQQLTKKVEKAINDFPAWRATQKKVTKTGNLAYWIKNDLKVDDREVEIIKRVLSDCYEELKKKQ